MITSLRANGSRECAPDDKLREAIHRAAQRKNGLLPPSLMSYGGQVVASLLAMTALLIPNVSPRSRGAIRPSDAWSLPPRKQRAQAKPGARCTRGLACKVHKG